MNRRRTNPPPPYDPTVWDVVSLVAVCLIVMVVW